MGAAVDTEPVSCTDCCHFRNGTSSYSQIERLIPDYARAECQTALAQIRDWEHEEVTLNKHYLQGQRSMQLPFRPTTFPYCGEFETHSVWFDAELRNGQDYLGHCGQDADFSRGYSPAVDVNPQRACVTCVNLCASQAPSILEKLDQLMSQVTQLASTDAMAAQSVWLGIRAKITLGASFEITAAYGGKGVLATRPLHIPWCMALSREGASQWVVGEIVNFGEQCPYWAPGDSMTINTDFDSAWALTQKWSDAVDEAQNKVIASGSQFENVVGLTPLRNKFLGSVATTFRSGIMLLGIEEVDADTATKDLTRALKISKWHSASKAEPSGEQTTSSRHNSIKGSEYMNYQKQPGRKKTGFLDNLLAMTGLVPADDNTSTATSANNADFNSLKIPLGPDDEVQAYLSFAKKEMDPRSDGSIAVTGNHTHPTKPEYFAALRQRDASRVLVSFVQLGNGSYDGTVLRQYSFYAVAQSNELVNVYDMEFDGGYLKATLPYGVWHDFSVFSFRNNDIPVRFGFLLANDRRKQPSLEMRIQWIS